MMQLDKKDFEQLVLSALKDLPEIFKQRLDNVDIVIEYQPTKEQRQKMHLRTNSVLFGLYEGVPQTKRANYTLVLPDKITIFQNSFEALFSTHDEIKQQVRKTVLHEIGHHFGMSEKELRKI